MARDDNTLINWSGLSRLSDAERARLFKKALEQIDDALSAPGRINRVAAVEQILMDLGAAENLKV